MHIRKAKLEDTAACAAQVYRLSKLLKFNYSITIGIPKKVRELIKDLKKAGFYEIGGGKGSHRTRPMQEIF